MRIGGIEAGGTKFVCGYGTTDGTIEHKTSFPTGDPDETCRKVIDYFTAHPVDAIGIGAFGPVDVKEQSTSYGTILDTPKTAWRQFPFLSTLKQALGLPMKLDTDVNCAALGEVRFSAEAEKPSSLVYITVGTGIWSCHRRTLSYTGTDAARGSSCLGTSRLLSRANGRKFITHPFTRTYHSWRRCDETASHAATYP